ncbi:hypothetical protein [Myroides phaeus]|uniref:Uncharacterized protein n=1 Tax=Myroides phaeus TaxID=702745 RepID=A0A1G8EBP9_9FLAO|nr:hypothetical protein [Myroides phaeus]SDH67140.1 hypothetical protein SAMN05421818_11015 [Myroides phaeus]
MKQIIKNIYKNLLTYYYYNKYENNLEKSRDKAFELTRIICFSAVTIPICLLLVLGYDSYHTYILNKGIMFKLFQYSLGVLLFFLATLFFRKKMEVDFDSITVGGCDESKSVFKCLTFGGMGFIALNITLVFVVQYLL